MRKLNKGLHLASLSVLALAVLLGAQGCGKKANGPSALGINPTYETIIPATTKVADTATAESLSAISPDATTLTFASTTSLLDSLATGDVLVFGVTEKTPFGLLRKVESVAKNAGEVVVTTSEARLTDAIQQGSINLQRTLHADEVVDFEPLVDGVSFEKSTSAFLGVSVPLHNVLIKDLDGNLSTTNDQATISGSFDLAPHLDIEIDIDIKEFEIEDCYLDVALGETLDLQVAAGAEMPISEELPIANVTFGTYVVFAGPIPIVLTPKATVSLFIEGNVSEGMNVGLTQKMLVNSKIGLIDEKWRVDKGFGNTFTIHPPEIFTSASFETGAKAQLALLLYGSFGPYGEFDASLKFGADINVNPWWWLDGCAEVNLGFSFKILSWSVADYHANIYQGCSRLLEAEGGFTGGGGNGGGGNGGGGNGGGTTGDYWAKTFGNLDPIFGDDLSDTGYVVDNAPNGGYYVGGWTGLDAWVIRLDGDGNITWEKMLTGGGAFWPNTGTATADGGFILAGRDGFGAWLAKFNSDGSLAWQKRYNFEGQNGEFFGIIQTSDGGYALAGWSLYYNLSFHSSFLMKLSADGNAQWIRNFNNVNGASAKSVSEAPNGDLLVAGDSGVNGWVARVSAGGTVIWERSYSFPDAGNTDILSVWANRHGGFVVIGDASLEGNFIAGVQDDGTPAWAVKYNFTYPGANGEIIESLNSIRQTDDGGYIVAGSLVPYGGTDHDYLVVRFNPGGGSAVWTKRIVGSEEDEALCAVPTADGGFIAVGQAKLPTSGTWTDILVTKFKSDGSINFNPSSALQLGEVSVQKAVVQLYKGEVTTVVTPPQVTIQDSSANIAQTNAVVTSLAP